MLHFARSEFVLFQDYLSHFADYCGYIDSVGSNFVGLVDDNSDDLVVEVFVESGQIRREHSIFAVERPYCEDSIEEAGDV